MREREDKDVERDREREEINKIEGKWETDKQTWRDRVRQRDRERQRNTLTIFKYVLNISKTTKTKVNIIGIELMGYNLQFTILNWNCHLTIFRNFNLSQRCVDRLFRRGVDVWPKNSPIFERFSPKNFSFERWRRRSPNGSAGFWSFNCQGLYLSLCNFLSLSLSISLSLSVSLCLSVSLALSLSLPSLVSEYGFFICCGKCWSLSFSLSLSLLFAYFLSMFLSLSHSVSVSLNLSLYFCLSYYISVKFSLSLSRLLFF